MRGNPILDRTPAFPLGSFVVTTGMISMITLLMKGIFCLMASFLLVASTRIEAICAVLRRIHVPSMLVTLLLLTYRYAAVLAEEANVMTQAYSLRAPGQKDSFCFAVWTGRKNCTLRCSLGGTGESFIMREHGEAKAKISCMRRCGARFSQQPVQ